MLNPKRTGTLALHVYDPSGTTLRRTSVWALVFDDNAAGFRGIMTSMTLPNGVPLNGKVQVGERPPRSKVQFESSVLSSLACSAGSWRLNTLTR